MINFVLLAILSLCFLLATLSKRLECCMEDYTNIGISCQFNSVIYENSTYTCSKVALSCPYCQLAVNISSSQCSYCCTISPNVCAGTSPSHISSTSWSKLYIFSLLCCPFHSQLIYLPALICLVFAVSFCCCSVVFLSAEHSRVKEGINFQEAYLLPIPIVAVDVNFAESDYDMPPDQPTAIARLHTSLDVTVAEPTEFSSLLSAR